MSEYKCRFVKDPEKLSKKIQTAFNEVVFDRENEDLLKNFRYTYEFKKGLYRCGDTTGLHERTGGMRLVAQFLIEDLLSGITEAKGQLPVDLTFKHQLLGGVEQVLDPKSKGSRHSVDFFAAGLTMKKGLNPDIATADELQEEVKRKFAVYWSAHDQGNSWDPL